MLLYNVFYVLFLFVSLSEIKTIFLVGATTWKKKKTKKVKMNPKKQNTFAFVTIQLFICNCTSKEGRKIKETTTKITNHHQTKSFKIIYFHCNYIIMWRDHRAKKKTKNKGRWLFFLCGRGSKIDREDSETKQSKTTDDSRGATTSSWLMTDKAKDK